MAIIKCPHCGSDISSEAKMCPKCGKKLARTNIKAIIGIVVAIVAVIIVGIGIIIFNNYQEQKKLEAEKQRQEEISKISADVEEYYKKAEFDQVADCYDRLDLLGEDTTEKRKILEYDIEVYEDAYAYYLAVKEFNKKLNNSTYGSLTSNVNKLKPLTDKFKNLEINTDSKIGNYIDQVRKNVMYMMFNQEFIYNTDTDRDLDYYLTQSGYVIVIGTYLDKILEIDFPYTND